MIGNIDRNSPALAEIFDTRTAWYIDYNGNKSLMKWIPPFHACQALTSTAAVATPSGTAGDWFHPRLIRSAWVENTDYSIPRFSNASIITGNDSTFAGASNWANVDINAYNATTGLTITANAANQYCTLPVANATTTVGKHYKFIFDCANIVQTWTVKSFDGTQTLGKIYANGTGQRFDFIAATTGGIRIVADADTSSADLDNIQMYEVGLGAFWADMYLCASADATRSSLGTVCSAAHHAYVSIPDVAPRTDQTIEHFRTYLKQRFDNGCFDFELSSLGGDYTAITKYANKGGLMTDAHWFDLWIWTRINRWLLRGNTYGYSASNHIPQWHLDANDIGILDAYQPASYGTSITGGGGKFWDIPISDFCGNRWEFTDGLRLYLGNIYTAGKMVNPWTAASDGYGHASFTATGLAISGCTNVQSIASYRAEAALKLHGIPASTTTAGAGGFDGQGFWFDMTLERIALRGGDCAYGALCPGALSVSNAPSFNGWRLGARAVLVP